MSDKLNDAKAAADAAGLAMGVPNAAGLIEMLADPKPETARALSKEEVTGVVRPLVKQLRDQIVKRGASPVGAAVCMRPPTDEDPEESRKFPVIAVAQLELRGADASDEILRFAQWLRDQGIECEGGVIVATSFAARSCTTSTVQEVIETLS